MFGNEADIVWTVIYHRSDYKKIKREVYIQGIVFIDLPGPQLNEF